MPDKRIELILQEIVRRINRTDDRLRLLEQRVKTLDSNLSGIEETTIKQNKEIKDKLITLETNLKIISDRIEKLENITEKITNSMKDFAKKNDLKEIEEMFSLLNPIKNEFVTKKELIEMLQK
jgi:Na+/phosphate symporter